MLFRETKTAWLMFSSPTPLYRSWPHQVSTVPPLSIGLGHIRLVGIGTTPLHRPWPYQVSRYRYHPSPSALAISGQQVPQVPPLSIGLGHIRLVIVGTGTTPLYRSQGHIRLVVVQTLSTSFGLIRLVPPLCLRVLATSGWYHTALYRSWPHHVITFSFCTPFQTTSAIPFRPDLATSGFYHTVLYRYLLLTFSLAPLRLNWLHLQWSWLHEVSYAPLYWSWPHQLGSTTFCLPWPHQVSPIPLYPSYTHHISSPRFSCLLWH